MEADEAEALKFQLFSSTWSGRGPEVAFI